MTLERELTPEESAFLKHYQDMQYDYLYKAACGMLGNKHLSYDIVQDTFLHAAENIEDFKKSPEPRGWLYKAMKHMVLHAIRDRSKLLARHIPLEEARDLAGDTGEFEINELDMENEYIQMMVRYYEYGYSLQEIADEWNTTVPAVKMRIQRAKKRLQKAPDVINLKNFYF